MRLQDHLGDSLISVASEMNHVRILRCENMRGRNFVPEVMGNCTRRSEEIERRAEATATRDSAPLGYKSVSVDFMQTVSLQMIKNAMSEAGKTLREGQGGTVPIDWPYCEAEANFERRRAARDQSQLSRRAAVLLHSGCFHTALPSGSIRVPAPISTWRDLAKVCS